MLLRGRDPSRHGAGARADEEHVFAACCAIAAELALAVVYICKASLFEGLFAKFLSALSVYSRYENFMKGLFDLTGVVYYLSVIALFLFSAPCPSKKGGGADGVREKNKSLAQRAKERLHTRAFRSGIVLALLALAATALAVGLNLAVSALPEDVTKRDTTPNALYTISAETENLLASLSEDVTVTLLATSGNEDATPRKCSAAMRI